MSIVRARILTRESLIDVLISKLAEGLFHSLSVVAKKYEL